MKNFLFALILLSGGAFCAAPDYSGGSSGGGGGTTLPVDDTACIVQGVADHTKMAKINVSAKFASGSHRTVFLPDYDTYVPAAAYTITFAGLTADRTITLPDGNKTLLATDGSGASLTALNGSNIASGTVASARLDLTSLSATNLTAGTVPDARFPATLPAASGVNLTALNATNLGSGTVPDARFPATLPATSGVNITALNATNLGSGTVPDARFPATLPATSGVNLTALNATNLGSGTVPDARFPATLPAASGVNLTALNASNLGSGTVPDARFPATLPALNGSALTALSATNLAAGTVPDARFPATLPAISGVNLTAINASNLGSGTVPDARLPATLPALSGVNLTALNGSNIASGTVAAARLPATTAYTDAANGFTKAQTITPDSDAVGQTLKRNAIAQTSNISEIKDESGNLMARCDQFGRLYANGYAATVVPGAATITNAVCTSKVVTFTTNAAHKFFQGMIFQTNNLSPTISNMNSTGYGWYVRSCPTTTTFTVTVNVADFGSTVTTGTVTPVKQAHLNELQLQTTQSDYGPNAVDAEIFAQATGHIPLALQVFDANDVDHIWGQAGPGFGYTYLWRIGRQTNVTCLESSTWLTLKSSGGSSGMCANTIENQFTGPIVIGSTGNDPVSTTGKDVGFSRRAAGIVGINGGNYQKFDTTADVFRASVAGRVWANEVANPTFSSGSVTTNVATITCTAAHNIGNLQYVSITGMTGVSIPDGTYQATVTSTTAFTFPYVVGNGTITAATIDPRPILNLSANPTTGDGLADVTIGASATTQKPLVVQAKASQTANMTEWQTSAGAVCSAVNRNGTFSGGYGAAVASAAAITPTGNVFHVTGTTDVTSITTTGLNAGSQIMIIFDGVLNFTDGNNLKLAGTFATTADDTITLIYDGTNLYETARSVN